jgi:hypothetical protein
MLLTDGNPNNAGDLRVYESAILSVANTEGIDLEVKLGLATEEMSQTLLDFLMEHTAVSTRRAIGVSDVVVTRQLKAWHAVHTLELVYRDAFNNQLNDRYQAKFAEYQKLSRPARDRAVRFGVGLVANPIPQAATPLFTAVAQNLPAATYFARVAWVAAGQEGFGSETTTYDAAEGTAPVVDAVNAPAVAEGFNVYLGSSADALMLQNSTPIAVGQSFTVPAGGLVQGNAPGDGQAPDLYVTGAWMLRRG